MLIRTLDLLRCPFCGTRLSVLENAALDRGPDRIESAVLGCECCAFPLIAGIPVLIADDATRDAMHALEAGRRDDALHKLLGLDETRGNVFRRLTSGDREPTYRELLDVLCPDAEADYMLHRFSDPTALLVEALLDGLGTAGTPGAARTPPAATASPALAGAGTSLPPKSVARPPARGRSAVSSGLALDLCGGCGHLTRVLLRQPACAGAVLADLHFWKLWLAARFLAPESDPVCCDANNPLPFTDGLFSTVLLSDAFPYIWHKRLLAGEMQRVATGDGVIAMPHLHSAHGENYSAGDTLSPAAYANLFATLKPRLFDDRNLLNRVLDDRVLDLANHTLPAACGDTPSITLVASRDGALYRHYPVADPLDVTGVLVVNPLYRVDYADGVSRLTLTFPTAEYEDEFAPVKRYLPASVTVGADLRNAITRASAGPEYAELRRRRILIDAPPRYC
ncbi:MAG: hypothetical protein F4137_09950 [Acidobacteria bacterium]|nr:hypothetical protein [Acidobacteriota bacterium]